MKITFAIGLTLLSLALTQHGNAAERTLKSICPELKGLSARSVAYRDTLQACKWDLAHPVTKR